MAPHSFMKIKTLMTFSSTVLGNVAAGEVYTVNPGYGRHLIEAGLAEQVGGQQGYETKVENTVPLAGGEAAQSGASAPGPASPRKTSRRSKGKTSKS